MFTGIIETLGTVKAVATEGTNKRFTLHAAIAPELSVDQSVAHDGVCLTVETVDPTNKLYEVVAIEETLKRSNLGHWVPGTRVNLERCLRADARLDGHFVQGHVDATGQVQRMDVRDGSWHFYITYPQAYAHLVVEKGSIAVNGVSLTVAELSADWFAVAIIPYTYEHTTFRDLALEKRVNLEFDILGKYVARAKRLQSA